jgi:predicted ATPase
VRLDRSDGAPTRGDARATWTIDRFRTRLEDIAFKRGAEWVWTGELEARATLGLDENSKAWESAALLAIDVHETVASFFDEGPQPFVAAVAMGRGIADVTLSATREWVSSRVAAAAESAVSALLPQVPPGRTWATGSLYRALRNDFAWEPEGNGHYALIRGLSRVERQERALRASGDFVGRFVERADLHGALHDASSANAGQGALTTRVLVGERGIGKTALVDAFLSELPPTVNVVRFECTPNHVDVQLRSLAALARAALGVTADMSRDAVEDRIAKARLAAGPYRGALAALVHNIDQMAEVTSFSDSIRMMVASVRRLLAARAQARALVVIVDQAQWLDPASLSLLPDLLRSGTPARVLALLVTRPEARVRAAMSSFVTMPLGGLSHDQLVGIVERRLGVSGGGAGQALAPLVPRVDGNPFFLLESVDALLEKGALALREREGCQVLEQTGSGPLELPASVEQVVAIRLEELPPRELLAVEWLAVAGVSLQEDELLACELQLDQQALQRLSARGICAQSGGLIERRQLLFFEVAYSRLAADRRAMMHRVLGERWLARPPGGVAPIVVARHLEGGQRSDLAGGPFFAAADQARISQQVGLATQYYRRALQLLPHDDPRHFDARAALERLSRTAGKRASRIAHLSALRLEAQALGTARAGATALLRTAQFEFDEGRAEPGLESVTAAASAAATAESPKLRIEALLLQAEILRELGRTSDAEAALGRALGLADDPQMGLQRAEVLRALGILRRRAGRVDGAIDAYREALVIAREHRARLYEARIHNALSYAMFVRGRYEETIACAMEAIHIDLEVGGRFQMAKTLTNLGHAAARLGDHLRAQETLAHARSAHARMHDEDGYADTLLVSAEVALEYETPQIAASWLCEARAQLPKASRYDQVHERIVTALIANSEGQWQFAMLTAQHAALAASKLSLLAFEGYALAVLGLACANVSKFEAAKIACARASLIAQRNQMGEFHIEALGVLLSATKLFDDDLHARIRRQLARALVECEAAISTEGVRQAFRNRPLVRNLLGKTRPSAVQSPDEAASSRPIG